MAQTSREITPINDEDLFILLNHPNADFDYPFHFHSEFEINLVMGITGQRIVGDNTEDFDKLDLVLIAPNIPHSWKSESTESNHVITIQFDQKLLNFPLLKKRMFNPIKLLLENAGRGIQFYGDSAVHISNKMIAMCSSYGFNATLDFFSLLYDLATAPEQKLIASCAFDSNSVIRDSKSRRVAIICDYINRNYMNQLKVSDIAKIVNMSDSALSHFFKSRTNRSLIDYINDIRIGNATKLLLETTHSINEICYMCGFNNISNFNRIFRSSKGITPTKYREGIQRILTKY
jgi:AraC-like DNA-binding protein